MPTINNRVLRRATRELQPETASTSCPHCDREFDSDSGRAPVSVLNRNRTEGPNQLVCAECRESNYSICDSCDEYGNDAHMSNVDGATICEGCLEVNYARCHNCNSLEQHENMFDNYCRECSNNNELILFRDYKENKEKHQSSDCGEILKSKRVFGIELETQFNSQQNAVKVSRDLDKDIGITGDSSINGLGLEIITPPSCGKKGEELIESVCKALQANRAKVDKSCGFHVHINVSDIDNNDPLMQFAQAKSIWLNYIVFEDVIMSFLSPSRRTNDRFCKALTLDYHFKEIADTRNMESMEQIWYRVQNKKDLNQHKSQEKHGSRYRGINMHTLFSERHLEIRYHMGTTLARKVLEWVNLHTQFVDRAIRSPSFNDLARFISLDLNQKTDMFFQILNLHPASEAYFRTRQAQFMSKPKEIDKSLNDKAKEVLSAEIES